MGKKKLTGASKGTYCQYCGKRTYHSRKLARRAADIQYPSEVMSVYTCRRLPEYVDEDLFWHIGHLTEAVKQGSYSRDEVYSRKGEPSDPPFSTGKKPPEQELQPRGLPPVLKRAMMKSLADKQATAGRGTDNDKEGNHGDNR